MSNQAIKKITVPETLWYEDTDGNVIPHERGEVLTDGASNVYQHTRSVAMRHHVLGGVSQKDVDVCSHDETKKTGGWIDGVEGRECCKCKGTQVRHLPEPWPEKWEGGGCYDVVTMNSGWHDDQVTRMVRSGDYTAREATLIAASCCERCMNILLHHYKEWGVRDDDGYPLGSDEEAFCGTSCILCDEVTEACKDSAVPCKGKHEFVEAFEGDDDGGPGEPSYICRDCDCDGVVIDDLVKKQHTDAGGDPLPDIVSETIYKYRVRGRTDKYPPSETSCADAGPGCCCDAPSSN